MFCIRNQRDTDNMAKTIIKKIKRAFKVIGSGICYSIFGLGALGLVFFILPILSLKHRKNEIEKRKALKKAVSKAFWMFVKLLECMKGISVSISKEDIAKLKSLKSVVLIANHPSLLDIVILLGLVPQGDCVVAGKLLKNPYFGKVVKKVYIPNTGDTEALLEACKKSMNEGNVLMIFPEGTRTTEGEPIKLVRGAANIALRTEKDIIPVHIECLPRGISKRVKWYTVPQDTMRYTFTVLKKIEVQEFIGLEKPENIKSKMLTEKMRQVLEVENTIL